MRYWFESQIQKLVVKRHTGPAVSQVVNSEQSGVAQLQASEEYGSCLRNKSMEWAEVLEKCGQVHWDRQEIDRCISSILAWRILRTEEPGGGVAKSQTRLSIPGSSVIKNPPATAGDARDLVHSQGEEYPLEEGMATHSCLENSKDRGA